MRRRHRWRMIAQFEITPEDARQITEGKDTRPPTQIAGDESPPLEDERPFFGLHNLVHEEIIVACIDCEMGYTDAIEAMECPGDPDGYGPQGEPLWDGEPLAGTGPPERHGGNVDPRAIRSVGRNDLCPCGSGIKYKRCHGAV